MTDSTQELDEILKEHGGRLATYAELYRKHHHNPSRHQADIDHAHNIAKQALLDWHNKQVEQAYSDGFQKASKGAFKSQQEAKREAVEAVLDRLDKETERCQDGCWVSIKAERIKLED